MRCPDPAPVERWPGCDAPRPVLGEACCLSEADSTAQSWEAGARDGAEQAGAKPFCSSTPWGQRDASAVAWTPHNSPGLAAQACTLRLSPPPPCGSNPPLSTHPLSHREMKIFLILWRMV